VRNEGTVSNPELAFTVRNEGTVRPEQRGHCPKRGDRAGLISDRGLRYAAARMATTGIGLGFGSAASGFHFMNALDGISPLLSQRRCVSRHSDASRTLQLNPPGVVQTRKPLSIRRRKPAAAVSLLILHSW